MSPIEIVRAKEEEIKLNRFETAFAVDCEGHILLDKLGEQFRVRFTPEEINHLSGGQGVIFTHNHPSGWDFPANDPRHAGASFSDVDVEFACMIEIAEMRVVTPTARFFLRPTAEGWNSVYWEDVLRPAYFRQEMFVKRDLRQALRGRQMTREEASARLWHEIWMRVAAETGLVYGREQE